MAARQSTLLRWTEAAEAAEICAYVELEREPQPAAVRRVEGADAVPTASVRYGRCLSSGSPGSG